MGSEMCIRDRSETWHTLPGGRFLKAARNAVFETLTEIAPDGTLQPCLATGWTADDLGRVWHFDLQEGVRFHDGALFTAADAAASLQAAGFMAFRDGAGLTVELGEADPALPFRLAREGHVMATAHDLSSGDEIMNGTGLYRVQRFDPGRGFLGTRVDTHRKDGAAGWFQSIELVAISDEAVRAEAVRDGHVHVADLSQVHDLEHHAHIQLVADRDGVAAVSNNVATGPRLGPAPLDDLRFVERWWLTS